MVWQRAPPRCRPVSRIARKPIRRGWCVLSQSADISERLLGQWLSDRLGQSFVIDNRPGVAGITIGTEAVVKAATATSATLYDRLLRAHSFGFESGIPSAV